MDGWKGQRVVFRHNTVHNALIGNHGTEWSGRLRGARSFEIYDNVIQYTGTTWPDAISFRSGTGVVFNNQINGNFKEAMRVDNYRDWRSFSPWGIASGESPFDKNDVEDRGKPIVYDTGTHTGDQGVAVLTCAGKKWAADQWQGYSVFNTTTGKSSIIRSNTANHDRRALRQLLWQRESCLEHGRRIQDRKVPGGARPDGARQGEPAHRRSRLRPPPGRSRSRTPPTSGTTL